MGIPALVYNEKIPHGQERSSKPALFIVAITIIYP
jgi:hypothetical protein